ncbi:hypothetical protein [Haloferula sp.]|uniref:hypothetical protein n=1 Tax=Haloferula sp. TaxID=2497595 RepID=UPI00329AD99B
MIDSLIACATCASNFRGDGNAAGWSILFMLAVIVAILGGVVFCMVRLVRREGKTLDPELCDDFDAKASTELR